MGNQPTRAMEAFQAMQQQGVAPNANTFSALGLVCQMSHQPQLAMLVLEAMGQQKVVPDAETRDVLIQSCANSTQLRQALKALPLNLLARDAVISAVMGIPSAAWLGPLTACGIMGAVLRFRSR